jgi:hypothetical protein
MYAGMVDGKWWQSNQRRSDSLGHFLFLKHGPAHLICNLWNVRSLAIAKNNNGDLVINVAPDFSEKAINSTAVTYRLVVVHSSNKPTVAVA